MRPSCHTRTHGEGSHRASDLALLRMADTPLRFLKNLKLVAVDELHYYHGVFGRSAHFSFKFKRRLYVEQ